MIIDLSLGFFLAKAFKKIKMIISINLWAVSSMYSLVCYPASSVYGWLAPFSLFPPDLLIPPLPSYWLLSFLLDQSGALGGQGETATHLYIVLNKYSAPQHMSSLDPFWCLLSSAFCLLSWVMIHRHKTKKTSLQFTTPENLDNKEDPKRDIHGFNLYGK